MADLEYSVGISGVDVALNGIRTVDAANRAAAEGATSRALRVAQAARDEEEWSKKIEAAKRRETQAFDAAVASARQGATATQQVTTATQGAVQQSILFATRLSGAANAVQTLTTQLGGQGRTAGLIGAMTGAAAQGAALGGLFGPGGAVVGGIIGAAVPAINSLAEAMRSADDDARELTTTLGEQVEAFERFRSQFTATRALASRGADLSDPVRMSDEDIAARQAQLEALEAGFQRSLTGDTSIEDRRLDPERRRRLGEIQEQLEALREEQQIRRETESDSDALLADLVQDAGGFITAGGEVTAGRPAPDRRAAALRARKEASGAEADAAYRGKMDAFITGNLGGAATVGNRFVSPESAQIESVDLDEVNAQTLERMDALAERQRTLAQESADAAKTFEDSWSSGLDGVRDAWEQANRAFADSGQEMMDMGDLLAMSMRSVGDDIATTIGQEMTGAFRTALTAWLDGSKSFIEAAEDMAKGVIQALTVEAIVQAVVEAARAIASFASQDYAGGVQHLAAAAAWGAVGVVAGGVGAAVGAFGGGGGGAPAGAERGDRQAGPSDVREGGQTNLTFIIQPGVVSTSAEVSAAVMQAIETAGREGYSVPARMLPAR